MVLRNYFTALQELAHKGLCTAYLDCLPSASASHPFRVWFLQQPNCDAAFKTFKRRHRDVTPHDEHKFFHTVARCFDNYLQYDPRKVVIERKSDVATTRKSATRFRRHIAGKSIFSQDRQNRFEQDLKELESYTGNPLNLSVKHDKTRRQLLVRELARGMYREFGDFYPTVITRLVSFVDPTITDRVVQSEIAKTRSHIEKIHPRANIRSNDTYANIQKFSAGLDLKGDRVDRFSAWMNTNPLK
jgi:hypothetical protein